jgi:hypothetical protein
VASRFVITGRGKGSDTHRGGSSGVELHCKSLQCVTPSNCSYWTSYSTSSTMPRESVGFSTSPSAMPSRKVYIINIAEIAGRHTSPAHTHGVGQNAVDRQLSPRAGSSLHTYPPLTWPITFADRGRRIAVLPVSARPAVASRTGRLDGGIAHLLEVRFQTVHPSEPHSPAQPAIINRHTGSSAQQRTIEARTFRHI